jgi:serine/threonine protein kinase
MPRGRESDLESSGSPPMVHVSPVPRPPDSLQAPGAHHRGPPKKNEQEMNDDFDRSFQIDAEALTLKHPLANGEGGIGEVWVGELVDHNGSLHDVAVKRYPSAFGPEEMKMFRYVHIHPLTQHRVTLMDIYIHTNTYIYCIVYRANTHTHNSRETAVLFLAAMRCHNVCKVYGTAEKDGKLCIIMKLYKESMRGLLQRTDGHKLSLEDVKRYGGDICKAIAELHEQNIILQDLKPPHILLDEYDHCVLADFGISKFVQGSMPHMPSHVQGTFNYMSPEAFDPEQFGGITARTDSWSFACTLLEMLTGDQPWKDMKMAPICFKVMQREV